MSARVETAGEAAQMAAPHWQLGGGGLMVGRPPEDSLDDVEPLIERALAEASRAAVHGQAVTPFVLDWLHRESGGRTLAGEPGARLRERGARGEIAAA